LKTLVQYPGKSTYVKIGPVCFMPVIQRRFYAVNFKLVSVMLGKNAH